MIQQAKIEKVGSRYRVQALDGHKRVYVLPVIYLKKWLMERGCTEQQTGKLIDKVDKKGSTTVDFTQMKKD